jgi:hypothetical protein
VPRATRGDVLKTLQRGADVTEDEIRRRIRAMLTIGDLDCDDAARGWAGHGSGPKTTAEAAD